MYFYIDETGHTGNDLFNIEQPILYYGVLGSNVDLNASQTVQNIITNIKIKLGVDSLHANQIGNKLASVTDELTQLINQLNLSFSFHALVKADFPVIFFFNECFDSGINTSVPPRIYQTGLKYFILYNLFKIFTPTLRELCFKVYTTKNLDQAKSYFNELIDKLIKNIEVIQDRRCREVIITALEYAKKNPDSIIENKNNKSYMAPNTLLFQAAIESIKKQTQQSSTELIVVDEQIEFNKHQKSLYETNQQLKKSAVSMPKYIGIPQEDYSLTPNVNLTFSSDTNHIGLQIVDIFLWLIKRVIEKKPLDPKLVELAKKLINPNEELHTSISYDTILENMNNFLRELEELEKSS